MNKEKIAITRKLMRLMPCASFWSKFKNIVRIGMRRVPPPIPSPPKMPETNPARI